jgi:oxygen-dependent protoporphyrinogen oxidase
MQDCQEKPQRPAFSHKRFKNMIGNLNPRDKRVTIIGAGISGLLIGYALKKRGFQVSIHEASSRIGGLIQTKKTSFGMAESAAHSLLVTPEIQSFFQELGVELVSLNPNSRARYIYRNGGMHRMPLRFFELASTVLRFFSKPKVALDFKTATLADWCKAYLGEAPLKYLLSPFVTGVFAASPEELNARISFPKLTPNLPSVSLFQWFFEGKKSPRAKMMAPKKGMEFLVHQLGKFLQEEIKLNSPIHSLVGLTGNIILTVPTSELSKLIAKEDPHSAELLMRVRYSSLISITCFYKKSAFKTDAPHGVGVLIPRGEGLRLLGCLFNSSAFPNRVHDPEVISLTAMLGGSTDPGALTLGDEEIKLLLHSEMKSLLRATEDPIHVEITRLNRAIPVYSQELKEAQDSLKQGFCSKNGQLVFNNYSKEVSIRSLINALHQI